MSNPRPVKRRKLSVSPVRLDGDEVEVIAIEAGLTPDSSYWNGSPASGSASTSNSAPIERASLSMRGTKAVGEAPICKFCNTMFLDLEKVRHFRSAKGVEHCTPKTIKEQAQTGCQLCGSIMSRFGRGWAKLEHSPSKFRFSASYRNRAKAETRQLSGFDSVMCQIDGEQRYLSWSAFTPTGVLYSSREDTYLRNVQMIQQQA